MMKKVQANRPSPSPRSLRALILEDNRQDVELMVALLKQVGYALSFEVVDSLAHLQQQLARTDYDIILAAHNLRTWTAMDALEILKKSRKDIPFVVVAGTLGGLAAVKCIKQGAAGRGEGGVPLWRTVSSRRIHRHEPGDRQPGGREVLQHAGYGGAVDQGRQAGGELDPSFLSSVPGE
jgi:CheY-like chemotaxis protein